MLWILGIIALALGIAATNIVMKNIASQFRMLRDITVELEEDIKQLRKLKDEDFETLDGRIELNKKRLNDHAQDGQDLEQMKQYIDFYYNDDCQFPFGTDGRGNSTYKPKYSA